MPTILLSFKIDSDRKVRMLHGFFGNTQAEAEEHLKAHAAGCPDFGPAYRADQTVEFPIEIEEIPEGNGDAIEDWLDEFRSFDDAEDDDDVIDV
jgi:hypothetical protein